MIRSSTRFVSIAILALVLARALTVFVHSETIVVPNGSENTFGREHLGSNLILSPPEADQQAYASSQFSGIGSESIIITGVSFRLRPEPGGSLDITIPRLQLFLGNFWGNDLPSDGLLFPVEQRTLVFDAENVHLLAAANRPPNAFDVQFTFSTPFAYDRREGFLVLESLGKNASGVFRSLDASRMPDSGGYIYLEPGGRAVRTGTVLVTEFSYLPIPEPAPFSLFLVYAVAALIAVRRTV